MIQTEGDGFSMPPVTAEPISSMKSCQEKFMRKLTAAVRQLGDIIDDEVEALRSRKTPDFKDINNKKARGLQTLSQLSSEREMLDLDDKAKQAIQIQLEQLQIKLARNQGLLQTHIEAVSELVDMIHEAAHAQETDGTYDPYCQVKQTYKGAS